VGELRPGWRRVKFAQLAECVNDRVDDPSKSGVDRYVGLDHLDPESLTIRRWGAPDEVESTKLRFKPGDIIFGKRRAYQRKLAVADFEGICSAHALVLRAKPSTVLPEFLPFFMQSDTFMERAVAISVGSLSPTINWKTLAAEEFALPPLEEQRRLLVLLKSLTVTGWQYEVAQDLSAQALASATAEMLHQAALVPLKRGDVITPPRGWRIVQIEELCSRITYGFTNPMPTTDSGPWMVTAKDVVGGRIDYTTARHTDVNAYRTLLSDKSRPRQGDVLLTKDGTLGRVAVVDRSDVCVNQSVAVLQPRAAGGSRFLFWLLRAPLMQQRLLQDVGGTAVKHLYIGKVGATRCLVPDASSQASIAADLDAIEAGTIALANRMETLRGTFRAALNAALGEL
jgi:type I restriction enzyme S subunit